MSYLGLDITVSTLDAVAACPASAVLPRVVIDMPEAVEDARERGNAAHDFLRKVGTGVVRDEALLEVPDRWRSWVALIELDRLPASRPESFAAEVAFAYNIAARTARDLGRGKQRATYDVTEAEIAGTADVVALEGSDGVMVLDYKTGRRAWRLRARDSWQVRTYGLMAARTWGADRATVSLAHIRDDGTSWFDVQALDGFDLDGFEAELQDLLLLRVRQAHDELLELGTPDASWAKRHARMSRSACEHCPSRPVCPAHAHFAERWVAIEPSKVAGRLVPASSATDEEWGRAYASVQVAKQHLDDVVGFFYTRALQREIPLPDGQILGHVEGHEIREITDGRVVYQVLAEMFGKSAADAAVTLESTVKAIESAVAPTAPRGQKKRAVDQVLALIEQRGGLKRKTIGGGVRVHPPKGAPRRQDPLRALPGGKVR